MTEIYCKCGPQTLEDTTCAECGETLRLRWIPVSERLPDPYMPVLILCSDGYMNVSIRLENDRGDITFSFDDIIYWMPLPPPPEDE